MTNAERVRKFRENHPGYDQTWYQNNRASALASRARWRKNNSEKQASAQKLWERQNPHKKAEYTAARRERITQQMPAWADRAEIEKFYILAGRLTARTGIPHEVDHIVPLRGKHVSGLHVPCNLQVVTRHYNRSKSNNVRQRKN